MVKLPAGVWEETLPPTEESRVAEGLPAGWEGLGALLAPSTHQ